VPANALMSFAEFLPRIDIPKPINIAELSAEAVWDEIATFEATLDDAHELGVCIVGGPAGLCVHVREVGWRNGNALIFSGVDGESRPVRLMQHLTQLNFLMVAVPKIGPVAVRIVGFHAPTGTAAE
jgi:hypothetical protein